MKHSVRNLLLGLGLFSTLNLQPSPCFAQGTALTYQGVLSQNGAAINGASDLTFTLYNAASGGGMVGASNVVNDLVTTNGLFTVTLDFGAGAFDGSARWLQIAVRPGAGTGAYTNLTPRLPITATPYAVYAAAAGTAGSASSVAASNITGTIDDGRLSANVARLNVGNTFSESQTIRTSAGGLVISSSTGGQFGSGTLRVQGNTGLGADPHPLYRLFVAGNMSASSYVGDGSQLANVAAETYLGPVADNQLSANIARRTNGNTFSGNQIIANGNLGIGTSTPKHKLDVNGNIFLGTAFNGQDFTELGDTLYLGASRKYLSSTLGAPINGSPDWINLMCHPLSRGILFGTAGPSDADPHSAPNPLMVIQSGGNVGIGTSTPKHKLDVAGNIFLGTAFNGQDFTELGDTLYLGASRKYLSSTLGAPINGSPDWINLMCHPLSQGILFGTAGPSDADPHSAPNPLMVIQSGGNVGIGATNPATTLDVRSATPAITVGTSGNTGGALYFGNPGHGVKRAYSGGNDVGLYTTAADVYLSANGTTTSQFVLKNNGDVGIGTNNPTSKLEVAGDTRINGRFNVNSDGFGNVTATVKMLPGDISAAKFYDPSGNALAVVADPAFNSGITFAVLTGNAAKPGGGSWAALSDARAKKNVHNLEGALSRLLALRSVTYEYKDPTAPGAKAGTQNGFIAQEVEPLFPDWVTTDAKGRKMLSISGFESLAVAALRELRAEKDAQLNKLEAQNAQLQEQNQSLEQRVAALEKLMKNLTVAQGGTR